MTGNIGKETENTSSPQIEAWITQMQGALGLMASDTVDGHETDPPGETEWADSSDSADTFETSQPDPMDIAETPPEFVPPENKLVTKLRLEIELLENKLREFYCKAQFMWQGEHKEACHSGMTRAKQLNARARVDLSLERLDVARSKHEDAKKQLDELEKLYRRSKQSQSKLLGAQIDDESKLHSVIEGIEQAGLQTEADQLVELEAEITRTFERAQEFCKDELGVELSKQNDQTLKSLEQSFQYLRAYDHKQTRQQIATTQVHLSNLRDVYRQGYQPLLPRLDAFKTFAADQQTTLIDIANERSTFEVWGVSLRKFDQAYQRAQDQVAALKTAAGAFEVEEATKAQKQLEDGVAALEAEQSNLEREIDAQRGTLQQIIAAQTSQFEALITKLQQLTDIEQLDESDMQEFAMTQNTLSALSRLVWGAEGWRVNEISPVLDASLEKLAALVAELDTGDLPAPEEETVEETEKQTAAASTLTKQFQKLKADIKQFYASWRRALEGEFAARLDDLFDTTKEITARFSKACVEKDLPAAQAALDEGASARENMRRITEQAKASRTTNEELGDYYECAVISLYCNRATYEKWDLDLTEIDSACTFIDQQVETLRSLQSGPTSAEAHVLAQQIEQAYKDGCKALEALEAQARYKKHRILAYFEQHLDEVSQLKSMANQLEDAAYYQFLEKSERAQELINKLLPVSNGGDVFQLRNLLSQIDSLMDELRDLLADVSSDEAS